MPGFIDTFQAVQLATMVAPVAVYFLILGLLNTRRHPQMLTGRQDFAVLFVAICPLLVVPVLAMVGITLGTILLAACAIVAAIYLLAPRGENWVIYNVSDGQVRRALRLALAKLDTSFETVGRGEIQLPQSGASIHLSHFALLRNVSIRIENADSELARSIEAELHKQLCRLTPEPHSMAVIMLLVATAMLVAPMTFMAHHGVPRLVRILSDLLP
jgi:Ca2+/Na+ antiporter